MLVAFKQAIYVAQKRTWMQQTFLSSYNFSEWDRDCPQGNISDEHCDTHKNVTQHKEPSCGTQQNFYLNLIFIMLDAMMLGYAEWIGTTQLDSQLARREMSVEVKIIDYYTKPLISHQKSFIKHVPVFGWIKMLTL